MNSVQNVFSQTKAGSVLNISKKMKQYQHKMSFHTHKKKLCKSTRQEEDAA